MATRDGPYIHIRLQQNMTHPENTTNTPNKGTRNISVTQDSKKYTATRFKKKGDTYKEIERKASERAGAQSITQHSSKHTNATTTTNKPHIRGIRSAWAILVWKL